MRLFLAVELPEEIRYKLRDTLAELKKTGISASLSKYHQLHVTLLFLGEKTEEEAAKIIEEAKNVKMGKFPIEIGGVGFFPSENYIRVVWVGANDGNGEIKLLHSKLAKALDMPPDKEFISHITLARVKSNDNLKKLKDLQLTLAEKSFGEFEADEFCLVKSELTPEGAKYSVVEKFSLG